MDFGIILTVTFTAFGMGLALVLVYFIYGLVSSFLEDGMYKYGRRSGYSKGIDEAESRAKSSFLAILYEMVDNEIITSSQKNEYRSIFEKYLYEKKNEK